MKKQELIKNAAECALKFLDLYSSTENMTCAYKAFEALAELTLKDLDSGASDKERQYDPFDIAQQMGDEYIKQERKNTINNAKKYLKDLMIAISGHNDTLKDIAAKNNLSAIPTVKYVEGGGNGNLNLYYIDYEAIILSNNKETKENISFSEDKIYENMIFSGDTEIQENINDDNLMKDNIDYFVEYIKLSKINNWRFNYELSGFRFSFEVIIFLLVLAITIILGIYVFSYGSFTRLDFQIISLYAFIIWLSKIKWDCITKRIIVISPPLTAPSKFTVAQLECIATDKIRERTGNPIRKIQLVSYWATCPICKNTLQRNVRIDVENGGREFHHRLIGRCSESPIEHVYSFDRVTRIGKPLR